MKVKRNLILCVSELVCQVNNIENVICLYNVNFFFGSQKNFVFDI